MNDNVAIHPGAIALARMLVYLGIAGLILYLMPWSIDAFFWGLIVPLMVVVAVGASLGLGGKAIIDFYNATVSEGQMERFKVVLESALKQEMAPA